MAVISDPDNLDRFDIIFGTNPQKISIYPVGDTQRNSGTTYDNVLVGTSGTLIRQDGGDFTSDGVTAGDVIALLDGPNAGHYYVRTGVTASTISVAEIDSGTSGAETTSLTVAQQTFDGSSGAVVVVASDQIVISSHGYVTGDAVVYDNGGGGDITGLTSGTTYYVIRVDANTIQLAASYSDAQNGTDIDLTVVGTGSSHTLDTALLVAVFTNGANTSESIGVNANDTSGDGLGDVADGITMQTIYSYGKEEWRTDSLITTLSGDWNDDLIRHEFPYEAITSEQFEVGGGASHDNWNWFNDYTRKKVRTGGWAEKTQAQVGTQDLSRYAGIVTLGSLDTDTQVYYQQVSVTTDPTNFTFLGVVNEAIQVYDDPNQDGDTGDGFNRLTFLKLFARKKGRTYAGSEIADIGVTTIQTIVNRFPLAHQTDTAITITDGELLGTTPYRNQTTVISGTDGVKNNTDLFFSSATGGFQSAVARGDILQITSGTEQGYYEIVDVDSDTQVTVAEVETVSGNDFSFGTVWASSETTLSFTIHTTLIDAQIAVDGTVTDYTTGSDPDGIEESGTSGIGTLTDTTNSPFSTVAAGDFVIISSSVNNNGVYKVIDSNTLGASNPTSTILFLDTSDQTFPIDPGLEGSISYKVVEPGMYLQFKEETTQIFGTNATDTVAFAAAGKTITLAGSNTWDSSVQAGTMIVVSGTTSNDGRFTVLTRDSDTVITLVSTDVLVDETKNTSGGLITVAEGFRRTIGSGTFSFRWRLFGNGGTLAQCFQFVQHQLRQASDIDYGAANSRGDVTDLLMSFASPTGTGLDMFIDDLASDDINNGTWQDHSGTNRNFPFTASGNLVFNSNLQGDSNAKYWLYFTNDNAGDNLGRDYGTENAIIVQDASSPPVNIEGDVNGAGNHTGTAGTVDGSNNISIPFTYDYDGNTQRGSGSTETTAPVTLVAIGLTNAQFVIATGSITRTTGITISAVAALERNYLNS